MKKCILLLVSFSTLFSCIINPVPVAEKPPEKINILSKIKPKMEYPYDIEVTKDGKTIYFKNWYNYPQEGDTYLDEKIPEQNEKLLKRRVIYKLDLETKKIELFKIGDDPLIYNELGNEMEIDNESNLYVNLSNHYINNLRYRELISINYIYKISSEGKILEKYDVSEKIHKPHSMVAQVLDNKVFFSSSNSVLYYHFQGPFNLYFESNNIFYSLFKTDIEMPNQSVFLIKKINLENKSNLEVLHKSGEKPYYFAIQDNLLFSSLTTFQASIFDLKTNKFVSNFDTKWDNLDFQNLNKNKYDNNKYSNQNNYESIKFDSKKQAYSLGHDIIYKFNSIDKKINIIGNYPYGYKDGKSNEASFDYPLSLSIDKNDNVYVADTGNNAIRKISPDGIVSTLYKEEL